MKKRGNIQKLTSFFLVFVMLLGVFMPTQTVFAAGLEQVETKITNFTITKSTGEVPPDGFKVNDFLKLSISWDASYYQNELKEGDYFNITLPDEFRFPTNDSACNFDILAPNGTDVVAKAVVTPGTPGGGNIKVTFTKYVEDRYDIKGSMYLNANFNTTIINAPGNHEIAIAIGSYPFTIIVPIAPSTPQNPLNNEILNKWVGQTLSNEGYVRWTIRINHRKGILNNVVITDQLTSESGDMTGIEYVAGNFKLEEVEMDEYGNVRKVLSTTDISDKVVLSPDKTSFTYNMGNIENRHFILRYNSTYREGLKLKNTAKLEADGESVEKKSSFSIAGSGGQGQGDLTSKIKIIKVDADKNEIKLANAKFLITKLVDNSTFELTTGTNGEILSNKLIPGKYKIKEIDAPDGYILDNATEYEVTVTSDGVCVQTIKNEPVKTNITVEKRWIGATVSPVTAILKADGTEVARHELTEATSWTHTFENLRKYQPGTDTEIVYTVEEETIPQGYTVSYETDPTGVLVIKNTQDKTKVKVTKEWEDVTGNHPAIKLQLLKNGQNEGSPIELTNGTTTHTWTALDKTDAQGNEYIYTVKEVGETANSIQLEGNWYKVSYGGNTQDGLTVINKKLSPWTPMIPPTRDVKVTKEWKDISGSNLNEAPVDKIKVELYKDGTATGDIKELTKDNNWTVTFEKLKVYESIENPAIHKYTVKEVGEIGSAIQFDGKWFKVTYDGTMSEGFTVTNKEKTPWTPMIPPTRDVKVTKEWKDISGNNMNEAPVEKIEVELYKDGVATGKKLELRKDNNWIGEFKNLEVADGLGSTNYYQYTVKEIGETTGSIKLDGKWFKVSYSGSMKDGFTITNQKEKPWTPMDPPIREVKVTKLWKDHKGNTFTAPTEKITVELYKDGNPTGKTLELNTGNNWSGVFKNLAVANGFGSTDYYRYTVKEVGEDGNAIKFDGKQYKVVYGGSMKDGLTITNEKETPPVPPTPPNTEKPKVPNTSTNNSLPKTGDNSNLVLWCTLAFSSLLGMTGLLICRRHTLKRKER
ncbi:MAG: Cna B-type domain-containing protein [Evtepia sp.]|uniref:Cna B-type domain-containing protein n=1 Tax=Evtepia sp. TaxID=2773933 RepID=UPI002A758A5A|nr:Cna B-type domain-containing protein [Evtepia sp.]MDY3014715.1 Cna B-type domain-containing protein [Evtepia sp.]